jgi:hypothetical protein
MLTVIKCSQMMAALAGAVALLAIPSAAQESPKKPASDLPGIRHQIGLLRPDLVVNIKAPFSASPGQDISKLVSLVALNRGTAVAPGTRGNVDRHHGYMIDVTLSASPRAPVGPAAFHPNWEDGVLLEGGRVSNTVDLAPRASQRYRVGAVIPRDTPAGRYFLCGRIDPFDQVRESSERNNTVCRPITIRIGQ